MIKVESLAAYKEYLRCVKQRFSALEKNLVPMAASMETPINEGRLFAELVPEGVIFFLDEERYYTLYYSLHADGEFPSVEADKPLLVEVLCRDGQISGDGTAMDKSSGGAAAAFNKSGGTAGTAINISGGGVGTTSFKPPAGAGSVNADRLIKAGFLPYRKNLLMQRPASLPVPSPALPAGYRMERGSGEDLPAALSLWDRYLELGDVPAQHRRLSSDDALLLIRDEKEEVAAVCYYSVHGRRSEGRHVVTEASHQRKGLASALLSAWLKAAGESGCEFYTTWINEENRASLALYQQIGFQYAKKYCRTYLKDITR